MWKQEWATEKEHEDIRHARMGFGRSKFMRD